MTWYRWQGDTLVLEIHLQPRATKNEVVGPHGQRLKIRLKSPPVDGKANAALLRFIADLCDVTLQQVSLVRGDTQREKTIAVTTPRRLPTGVPTRAV
ncbi:MAG: DUF167 family protein [Gammaproteobacteria bacterium]|nr:DUF167 family protein [Gammaproteobacteria bacterium]